MEQSSVIVFREDALRQISRANECRLGRSRVNAFVMCSSVPCVCRVNCIVHSIGMSTGIETISEGARARARAKILAVFLSNLVCARRSIFALSRRVNKLLAFRAFGRMSMRESRSLNRHAMNGCERRRASPKFRERHARRSSALLQLARARRERTNVVDVPVGA